MHKKKGLGSEDFHYNEEKAIVLMDDMDDALVYDESKQMDASISFVNSAKRQSNIIFKHGWLVKQGYTFKTFHRRYFVLLSNGQLKYYTSRFISRDNKMLYFDPTSPSYVFLYIFNIL